MIYIFSIIPDFVLAEEPTPEEVQSRSQYLTISSMMIFVFYFLVFEGLFRRTPGKILTQTKVTSFLGEPASFLQIVLRTLGRFIPFDVLSYFLDNPQGWHDMISQTYVVDSDFQPSEFKE
ncbi:Hypothetical protein PBC10988_16620 [Planctomycetales bacterium 10988]|nr:Hypothetical protein PBC10988_16620 [Planctomycetales bacterium 10988]